MRLFLQMLKLLETTSYFDENAGRVVVKSDTVIEVLVYCHFLEFLFMDWKYVPPGKY